MVLMCFSHKNIAKTFTQNVHLIDVERHGHFDKKCHKFLNCTSNWKATKKLNIFLQIYLETLITYKYMLMPYCTYLSEIDNGIILCCNK